MDYTVQSGDTLFLIARRFGLTLDALLAANPGIRDPDLIYPGQVITVPVGDGQGDGMPGIPGQKPLNLLSVSLASGGEVQGSTNVPANPRFILNFDKNVVSDNVWENNRKSFSLQSQNMVSVPIDVTRIPETVDFSQRQNIFIQPQRPLTAGTAYGLHISPQLRSKAGVTLGRAVTINFRVIGQAPG
ncbi:MAG: LysM peptidoglycan-binding domain-containing protein [Desulfotomaculaceae bacterium]|nr:LysM peptidoglycan-binding domain-containing protein [Bacillota bacterium]MDD4766955.1 LysM peptidoglycan-binding domain-containing protein [Desulfotomaculaceae bacterium]OQA09036.1 MAG: Chlorophenol reductase precursor [Firmicutes bacterium ADurb.Bin373]